MQQQQRQEQQQHERATLLPWLAAQIFNCALLWCFVNSITVTIFRPLHTHTHTQTYTLSLSLACLGQPQMHHLLLQLDLVASWLCHTHTNITQLTQLTNYPTRQAPKLFLAKLVAHTLYPPFHPLFFSLSVALSLSHPDPVPLSVCLAHSVTQS